MTAELQPRIRHTPTAPHRLLRPGLRLQRACACGGSAGLTGKRDDCEKKNLAGGALQTKLTVNQPGDIYEQEADRAAEQVMRMPAGAGPMSHRAVPTVSRLSFGGGDGAEAPAIVHDVLGASGRPLDASTRAFMEPRFGHDFGGVKVHTDARAAQSARAVNALAYTVGNNVVFGEGQYAPGAGSGQRLLAHELAHVVQQGGGQAATSRIDYVHRPKHQRGVGETVEHALSVSTAPCVVQRYCNDGKWYPKSNGCSIPNIALRLLGASEKDNPAGGADTHFATPDSSGPCDKHDVCYQTLAADTDAREKCDRQFMNDMISVCHASKHPDLKSNCYRLALRCYQAVRVFGGHPFRQNQRKIRKCEGLTHPRNGSDDNDAQ